MQALRSLFDRPLVLLVLGSVGLLFSLVAAIFGVQSLTRLADIDDVPRCERDFAGECRTERETLVTGGGTVQPRTELGHHADLAAGGPW